jgi:thiol:disulfide interchange protein DsbD
VRVSLLVPISILIAATLPAQIPSSLSLPKQELVKLTGTVNQRSGDQVRGVITATIENGWHINSAHPLDSFAIPTALSFDPGTAELISAEYPQHTIKTFTFSGGNKLAVYEGAIQIPFTAKMKGGATALNASLHYQACNDTICLPPRDAKTVVGGAKSVGFTPLSEAPKERVQNRDRLSSAFFSHGLPLTLLILFIGGLALNLTPCVFPMIPITIGFFAMQSDGRR